MWEKEIVCGCLLDHQVINPIFAWLCAFGLYPSSCEVILVLVCANPSSCVTPRSCGYGDVTATYIRRSEIPSRIYAKHQYRQESEYGSKWCIIHSTHEYNYKVITRGDPILHKYYITRMAQLRDYKEISKNK